MRQGRILGTKIDGTAGTAVLAPPSTARNYAVLLIVVYLWIFVAEPQRRFEFLDAIHFERLIMAFGWAALFLTGRLRTRFSGITALVIVFYAWMLLSYVLSPYQNYMHTDIWLSNYWKLIVFYFLVLFAINDLKDLTRIFKGFVIVLFVYQLHSWFDFANGGSYVYQQGVKRIVGVWSGGIGAANAFGMIALFSLPFALFWFNSARKTVEKAFLLFYFLLTTATIIFSGTRAALVGLVFMLVMTLGGRLKNRKIVFLLAVMIVAVVSAIPEELKHRYFDLTLFKDETEVTSRVDEIAIASAEGRKEGLIDGLNLGLKRPVFGYGPGASSIARLEVRPMPTGTEQGREHLQLHNLYGQIVSETGFGGALIFLSTLAVYFYQLRRLKHTAAVDKEEKAVFENFRYTFYLGMLVWLFYGFFSHTLYRYPWFLLFGCQGALIDIASRMNGRGSENINGLKGRV